MYKKNIQISITSLWVVYEKNIQIPIKFLWAVEAKHTNEIFMDSVGNIFKF